MTENILARRQQESIDDWLFRLGSLKEAGIVPLTWTQLTNIFNEEIKTMHAPLDESSWRKRYRKLVFKRNPNRQNTSGLFSVATDGQPPVVNEPNTDEFPVSKIVHVDPTNVLVDEKPADKLDEKMLLGEKIKVQVRDERTALNRRIRNDARNDVLMDLFREEIRKFNAQPARRRVSHRDMTVHNEAIYAMLSDIHYGIAYDTAAGKYNPNIAYDRVLRYAEEIADLGELHQIDTCYVSLLGDLISGNIHNVIRVENRENIVQQVIGVSELIAEFLHELSSKFQEVHVNAVSGNHSRLDLNADDALRGDKLDELIPWYCKTKLANCDNIVWHENVIDATIGDFDIYGINYITVHGDYDNNLQRSASQIERMTRQPIDYIVAGHMHVPELRLESIGMIRNGSVCGSGDEYTMKKRLFGYPCQVCLIVNENGIKDYIPIAL